MKKLPYDIERQFTKMFQYISEYMNNVFCEDQVYIRKDLRIMLKSLRKIIVEHLKNKPKPPVVKEREITPVVNREIYHLSFFACGSCGTVITNGDRFCRMCGKGLKWD